MTTLWQIVLLTPKSPVSCLLFSLFNTWNLFNVSYHFWTATQLPSHRNCSFHVTACIQVPHLCFCCLGFSADSCSCLHHFFFMHSPIEDYSGCFQFLIITEVSTLCECIFSTLGHIVYQLLFFADVKKHSDQEQLKEEMTASEG